MKISKITLTDYHQFKNLEINLAYPKGHPKEGKPLDKICIIGQSGTGKTSLLRLINWFVSRNRSIDEKTELPVEKKNRIAMEFELFDLHYKLRNRHTDLKYDSYGSKDTGKKKVSFKKWEQLFTAYLDQINPYLIHYPTELISKRTFREPGNKDKYLDKLKPQQVIDFAFEDMEKAWHYLLKDVKEHRGRSLVFMEKISTEFRKGASTPEVKKKERAYDKWLLQNPNPLRRLAETCIDP